MTDKIIGIVGYGVVGKAIDNTLSKFYNVCKYDIINAYDSFSKVASSDLLFIAVPTPFDYKKQRVIDEAVVTTLSRLDSLNYQGLVVIKSTIPPGSCDKYNSQFNLKILFNPEFLRESTTPNEDFANQHTVVVGSDSLDHYEEIKKVFKKVLPSDSTYFQTTYVEAEMIKVAQNTMLASRVALANIIFDACVAKGVDYELLKKIAFDRFEIIGPHMSVVPGPDGNRGFGGKCLPKDTLAFNSVFESNVIKSIIAYNETLRNDLEMVLENFSKKII